MPDDGAATELDRFARLARQQLLEQLILYDEAPLETDRDARLRSARGSSRSPPVAERQIRPPVHEATHYAATGSDARP
jgi:hypothetical protein